MMKVQRNSQVTFLLIASLLLLSGVAQALAPQQRNRPSRRITNPIPSQGAGISSANQNAAQAEVISTTDSAPVEDVAPARSRTSARETNRAAPTATSEQEQLRRTVNRLSAQVAKLAEDVNAFKEQQRTLVDLERLTRAEQRADSLRGQLRTVTDREFELQAKLEQLTYELQPDVIQQRTALVGAVRPDAVRESLQRQLENERTRVRQQLELTTQSRTRLERSIQDADTEVERLRSRLDAADTAVSPQTAPRRRNPRTSAPNDAQGPAGRVTEEPAAGNTANMPR